jgi:Fusaric acid resistance protein-like
MIRIGQSGRVTSRLANVFAVNRQGLNVSRGIEVVAVLAVPFVVLTALGEEQYLLSATFGVLFVALSDPGGKLAQRLRPMAWVAVGGALLTAFGFAIGNVAWGFVMLAGFVVTLLCGLMIHFGIHAFVAALLVNIWFLIALTLPAAFDASHVSTSAWSQGLAWLIGSALWVAVALVVWLARRRRAVVSHFTEIPGDTTPMKLTRPFVLFAVIRAVAVAISVAIAFGLNLPYADWMPVATIVAMKPSLAQSALFAEQRLAGAVIGAATAALFLLTIDNRLALVVAVIIFSALAVSIRGVNYALYCAAVAAAVLIAIDLPNPSNLGNEGRRVLFTFIGVGIAVVVLFIANLLQKRLAPTTAPT